MIPEWRERIRGMALAGGGPERQAERELLLRLATVRGRPQVSASDATDWSYLLRTADAHGLIPILSHHLSTGALGAPATVAERLRAAAGLHLAGTLRLTGALVTLVRAFRAEGVTLLAYKGPALSLQAYGHGALRQISDLDVVVEPGHADAADAVLRRVGYTPEMDLTPRGEAALVRWEHHRSYEGPSGDTLLELHWRFAQDRYGFQLGTEQVIARCETLPLGGVEVPVPGPEDVVLLQCVHGARHLWERLEWLAAVGDLLRARAPDWTRLLGIADQARSRRLLLVGLTLADALVAAPVAEPARRAALEDPRVLGLASTAAARLFAGSGSAMGVDAKPELFMFNLRGKDALRDRLRFAMGYLTTPTEDYWYGPRLPDALFPLYRLYRPFRLAGQYLGSRLRSR
jgi:hypothetical protein